MADARSHQSHASVRQWLCNGLVKFYNPYVVGMQLSE
jgi:hypothetical protein